MIVLLVSMLHLQPHVKALEQTGWRRRLTSLFYRALRRHGSVAPLLLASGHAATLAESRKTSASVFSTARRTYKSCSG
jgi:hypothetical protein